MENARAEEITVRAVRLPDDAAAIDASVRCAGAYRVRRTGRGFPLDLVRVAPHTSRSAPADALAGAKPHAAVFAALVDERVVGVLRTTYAAWNRRLAIAHAYVEADARRRGVGRSLVDAAMAEGARRGAEAVWTRSRAQT